MSSRSPICAMCSSASSRARPRPTSLTRCYPGLGRPHRPRPPSRADARGAVATLTHEEDCRDSRDRAFKPGRPGNRRTPPAARSPATTGRGTAGRDQRDHCRHADLRLSPGSCLDPATTPRTWRGGGQRQAGLPGDEGARVAARAPPAKAWRGGMMAASPSIGRIPAGARTGSRSAATMARIAFTLDCCDREAISWVATTGGIDSGDVRDLMIESVERRFGLVNRLPLPIQWLSDNGSPYTARETRALAREIGLVPCTTPIESPQSNGMAEAFLKTFKRDYARISPCSDAATVLRQLDGWFEHYNTVHPHRALGYRSPREFRKRLVDEATENAVGALRRSPDSTVSADALGSRPSVAPRGLARSASLDASPAVDHP